MANEKTSDATILHHIRQLGAEEQELYGRGSLEAPDVERLHKIGVELDQCWDFLRQRQALRDAGQDPAKAHIRPPSVVENYEQ